MTDIEIVPRGPFSLAAARGFAGGFPAGIGGGGVGTESITLAFPVEGTDESAAVELWQDAEGVVRGRTDAPDTILAAAIRQAARSLSLDHDGSGWPAVGERDPVVGDAQLELDDLRPVCFYSAYEAATSFVIGQRIGRRQSAASKRPVGAPGRTADHRGDAHSCLPAPRTAPRAAPGARPHAGQGRLAHRARPCSARRPAGHGDAPGAAAGRGAAAAARAGGDRAVHRRRRLLPWVRRRRRDPRRRRDRARGGRRPVRDR